MFWDIVIIAGVFWIIMSIFSFLQSVQVRNIYTLLEPRGKVYFGRDAGVPRTKYIAFAAVNPDGVVLDAKLLKASRIITPSKIQPMECLIDKNLLSMEPASLNLDTRTEAAIQSLRTNFKKTK